MEEFQPTLGTTVHSNVRCLIGLYGSNKDDVLNEAFSAVLYVEPDADPEILRRALDAEDADQIRFLVGSQSLKSNENQVTLVTLVEADDGHPARLIKRSFSHPDGEILGLTALAAQPSWFVSVYSTYSTGPTELRSGSRVWRLPDDLSNQSPDSDLREPISEAALEYVTSLPLGHYGGVKKIVSHPSTSSLDLACLVCPPVNSPRSAAHSFTATTYLSLLQAPSASGSAGEYREVASSPLYWPSPSHVFASHLKTHPNHMMKTSNSTAVTSASHAIRWSTFQQAGHLAVAFESGVLGWDIRSMQPTFWLEAAHWPCVRDLDFNPHRPTVLATGGDDGHVRLWDLRYLKPKPISKTHGGKPPISLFGNTESCTEPLYSLAAHSHWVWLVRYHPTRDQLLLSTGSDCRVCLHNVASFSSDAPDDTLEEEPEVDDHRSCASSVASDAKPSVRPRSKDGLVARMELHEESVYAADWSPVDPWYFASVSYDGNLLINQVPEKLKFSILLDSNEE